MEAISQPTPTTYKQVTVDVPEERLAEFHAFFARFLADRGRRERRGEHRRHGHRHGHGCPTRGARAGVLWLVRALPDGRTWDCSAKRAGASRPSPPLRRERLVSRRRRPGRLAVSQARTPSTRTV